MAEKRRMRVRRKKSRIVPPNSGDINGLDGMLHSIAAKEETIIAMSAQVVSMREEAFKEMKRLGLKEHKNGRVEAAIVRPAGRSKTEIDAREYHEAVIDDDIFYDSITVSVSKAKEHLSGKELNNVATVTPAKPGDPMLKLKIIPQAKEATQEDAEAA